MDDQDIDRLLAQRREAPLPPVPTAFQQSVWREIRRRKAASNGSQVRGFGWLLEPLLRPAMAFAALSLSLVLGIGLGATELTASRNSQTRLALDLEVFGSSSPALPATLIASSR